MSVVVPVRNEGPHLERAVTSILAQGYPQPFDICLAVAPSDDDTFAVARRLATAHDRVSMVANPAGVTPAGLNAAISATMGSIVVRVDGHAELSDGYVRRAVETMIETGAVNVGGMQVPMPETPFETVVAAATTSWMGTGGASYRIGGAAAPVDTVYLGVFDRAAGDAVGWFDERLIRNQDYELNIRLRQAGGTVWFDPELAAGYRPRGTWQALAKQYYEYGYWKAGVAMLHPGSLRLRQVAPVVFATAFGSGLLASVWRPIASIVPLTLSAGWLIAAATIRGHGLRYTRVAAVLPTIHLAWGVGFIHGALFWRTRTIDNPSRHAHHQDHPRPDIVLSS